MSLERTLQILDRLIAFPTVSRDSNLALIAYVQDLLAKVGVDSRVVHNEEGTKANLHAVVGPAVGQGVMLSGHSDVVPVEGQDWSSDPFVLTARGERLLGRGTADMKGFIACALAVAEEAASRRLSRPLHLAFSYDEEIGCVGVRRLLDTMTGMTDLPAMCIIGEPTCMETVTAHKGKVAGRVTCRGYECHSSHAPEGLNAIYLAHDMVGTFREMQDELEGVGHRDAAYSVPFTTVHVGTLKGGTALNIVPGDCTLDFEIRNLPADDPQTLLARLYEQAERLTQRSRQRFPDSGVKVEVVNAYPGMETDPQAEVVGFVNSLTGGSELKKIAFGTEGGLFTERLGIPTVVCGPGDIRHAHKPDEFVTRDQLGQCHASLRRLLDTLAA